MDTFEIQNETASALPMSNRAQHPLGYLIGGLLLTLLVGTLATLGFLNTTPSSFVLPRSFNIEEGMGITSIAEHLESEGLIRSSLLFKIFAQMNYPNGVIAAGEYRLDRAFSTQELVRTLMSGETDITLTPVTFPEGWSIHDLEDYVGDVFTSVVGMQ